MTFADGYNLRTTNVKFNDVASAVDALLAAANSVGSTALVSNATGSYADYSGMSTSITVNAGEIALVVGVASVSNGTTGGQVGIRITQDGTAQGVEQLGKAYVGDTTGAQFCLTTMAYISPSAGSHTYKLQLYNFGGTAYSTRAYLMVFVFQNS